ncbi:YitT family protein [Spirosoma montaniterrae]|uniref:DUF2179 domain-containing protein n=1 Tax=Spirosoma montaniterrae TaxID=1178516 RepID=A0A1P9WVT4_9BACT|nr:YitT family protein [Spirosoma montaniterrae]AQG79497.1 hypothetical protein AWR27_09300 [Spirosoma montaniterrae]
MAERSKSPNRIIKDTILIVAGALSAGLGLEGFLLSSRFIDGGVTGISMLLADLLHLPLAILLVVINLPFILLGYKQFGRLFALKSAAAIGGLSLCLTFIPYPDITPDLLLTAVFGGFFIGLGIGLTMRGGAVLDGTEIAALLISRSNLPVKVGDAILLMNVFIFSAAAFFLGMDLALYSMITYFAASKTVDFVIHGIEQYTTVLIISQQHETLRTRIIEQGWGVTVLNGEQGYGKQGHRQNTVRVLYVVLTRLQLSRLLSIINEVDASAFVIQHSVDDVTGGKIKSRPLH